MAQYQKIAKLLFLKCRLTVEKIYGVAHFRIYVFFQRMGRPLVIYVRKKKPVR